MPTRDQVEAELRKPGGYRTTAVWFPGKRCGCCGEEMTEATYTGGVWVGEGIDRDHVGVCRACTDRCDPDALYTTYLPPAAGEPGMMIHFPTHYYPGGVYVVTEGGGDGR